MRATWEVWVRVWLGYGYIGYGYRTRATQHTVNSVVSVSVALYIRA